MSAQQDRELLTWTHKRFRDNKHGCQTKYRVGIVPPEKRRYSARSHSSSEDKEPGFREPLWACLVVFKARSTCVLKSHRTNQEILC